MCPSNSIRLSPRDRANVRVEMIALDKGGGLTARNLDISDREREERFMMNLGGYNPLHGDGAGLRMLQDNLHFKAEIVPGGGSRVYVAAVMNLLTRKTVKLEGQSLIGQSL